jgi:hypothetical protein
VIGDRFFGEESKYVYALLYPRPHLEATGDLLDDKAAFTYLRVNVDHAWKKKSKSLRHNIVRERVIGK